ncbi:MAG: hypothetical protein ACRDDY_01080 [Clostridium sp.]|uniref:hypothetical protein n=1 Tax=Clostridium sp. TaxID=1506 RepID=UPI003EE6751D
MRALKEIMATPINSLFIVLVMIISLISINVVNQIIYGGYSRFNSERAFNKEHIAIELNEEVNNIINKITEIESGFITNKMGVNVPMPGGFFHKRSL